MCPTDPVYILAQNYFVYLVFEFKSLLRTWSFIYKKQHKKWTRSLQDTTFYASPNWRRKYRFWRQNLGIKPLSWVKFLRKYQYFLTVSIIWYADFFQGKFRLSSNFWIQKLCTVNFLKTKGDHGNLWATDYEGMPKFSKRWNKDSH